MAHQLDPALASAMRERHKLLMENAALEAATKLEENLGSTEGSGVQYPSLPHRSSAPGEYPTKQSGDLQAGVTAEPTEGTTAQVVIRDDEGKLLGLEFSPPSSNPNQPGVPHRKSGGRAPMWETMTDPDTIAAMNAAIKGTP